MPSDPNTTGTAHSEASEWDELEARSLVFTEMDGPQERLATKRNTSNRFRSKNVLVLISLAFCAFMVFQREDMLTTSLLNTEEELENDHEAAIIDSITEKEEEVIETKDSEVEVEEEESETATEVAVGEKEDEIDDTTEDLIVDEETEAVTEDVVDKDSVIDDMIKRYEQAYENFHQIVQEEYGEFTDKIFNKETISKSFFHPSEKSPKRLQRRILIKILEAIDSEDEVNFNWAIGGHSAAAGHGNLFNQTYGYVIEDSVRPVFEALGVTFYGRNYAMGGMKSAPESAFCMSSLYGPDLDILSWDFGMTDGSRASDLYNIWSQKAGIHPTHPTLVSYGSNAAKSIHPKVEAAGMSAFEALFIEEKREEFLASIFPDSDGDDIEVEDLPKGVKYYRCSGHTEGGELCGDNLLKFDTKKVCASIKGQVQWHNGWKDHLFKGRVSAAFLIGQVHEALQTLQEKFQKEAVSPETRKEYLTSLRDWEAADKAKFLESETPRVPHFENELEEYHDSFLRAKSICHYGYLPAYARFEGLVTGKRQSLSYVGGGRTSYTDEGEDYKRQLKPTPDDDSEPRLVYNYNNDRLVCKAAEIDFKDFFGIRNEDKSVVIVLPNDAENEAFSENEDWKERLGLITLCEIFFAFSRYPADHVALESLVNSTVTKKTTMTVNDVPVTNVTKIGTFNSYCYVLSHEDGYNFPSSDKHGLGRYEIKFEVPQRGGQLYLSSMIVI